MKSKLLITILGLLTLCNVSFGQDTLKCNDNRFDDPLLQKLIGKWVVYGKIGDDNINYNFTASWELNHQFVLLTMADTASQPQYTASVFIGYDCVSERYVAHWLDNFGGRFSETLGYGIRTGQSIEFRFEYPDGPFINKFIYNDKSDTWQFHSTTRNSKGIWVTFGDLYLKK